MNDNTLVGAHVRTLAAIKYLKDQLAAREKASKNALLELVGSSATLKATADAAEIGTVTIGTGTPDTYTLTDPEAYAEWAETQGIETATVVSIVGVDLEALEKALAAAGRTVDEFGTVTLAKVPAVLPAPDELAETVAAAGLVPDGVSVRKGRAPSVTVRQTKGQADNLLGVVPELAESPLRALAAD